MAGHKARKTPESKGVSLCGTPTPPPKKKGNRDVTKKKAKKKKLARILRRVRKVPDSFPQTSRTAERSEPHFPSDEFAGATSDKVSPLISLNCIPGPT